MEGLSPTPAPGMGVPGETLVLKRKGLWGAVAGGNRPAGSWWLTVTPLQWPHIQPVPPGATKHEELSTRLRTWLQEHRGR